MMAVRLVDHAKLFVEQGAYVFIAGRRQEQLDGALEEIGRNVRGVRADSGNLEDLDRLHEVVKRETGTIDVLFASAGAGWWVPLEGVTAEHFAQTFDVNVKGTLFTVAKALPLLSEGASVIPREKLHAIWSAWGRRNWGGSSAVMMLR